MSVYDTCAAISTAHGKAGIAVIRMTGSDSVNIASKVFFPRSGKKLVDVPHAKAVFGDIYYSGDIIDNGICTIFYAPHSFTGEDTVEISCHGSELGTSLVLSSLFAAGAIPAPAGEFTKRAFLNGKLSLMQAEAVAELLDAQSTSSIKLSIAKADGKLDAEITDISEKLKNILGSVYAYIDYPDEDLADMDSETMRGLLFEIKDRLLRLTESYNSGRAITSGIPTSVVGLPNSGKSSLLNMLLKKDRCIVTDIEGTTRDVITEKATIGNIILRISDTAGIRKTDDAVEQIGVRKTFESIDLCELILVVLDLSKKILPEEEELLAKLSKMNDKKVIVILNKSDIEKYPDKELLAKKYFKNCIKMSVKNNVGENLLSEKLTALYPCGDEEIKSGLIITGARIYACLNNCLHAVCDAIQTLESFTPDVAGMDLERALGYLEEADGRSVTEEIVSNIFSRSGIGK